MELSPQKSEVKNLSALYPGSFDPITNGHIDIIKRFSIYFNPLIILVCESVNKKNLFSLTQRLKLVKECVKDIKNVEVTSYKGLTIQYAKNNDIKIIIRGVRTFLDFEYELAMASTHKKLFEPCETIIAFTKPEYTYISSRVVKELAFYKECLKNSVPKIVAQALENKNKE